MEEERGTQNHIPENMQLSSSDFLLKHYPKWPVTFSTHEGCNDNVLVMSWLGAN
jgi:hypothetical protein